MAAAGVAGTFSSVDFPLSPAGWGQEEWIQGCSFPKLSLSDHLFIVTVVFFSLTWHVSVLLQGAHSAIYVLTCKFSRRKQGLLFDSCGVDRDPVGRRFTCTSQGLRVTGTWHTWTCWTTNGESVYLLVAGQHVQASPQQRSPTMPEGRRRRSASCPRDQNKHVRF